MSVHTFVVLLFSVADQSRWHHKDNHDGNSALLHHQCFFLWYIYRKFTVSWATLPSHRLQNITDQTYSNRAQKSKAILRWPTRDGLRVGLSSFVNPQKRQNLASVINSDPQREQNILPLTLHGTLRLRLRLQEGKRRETAQCLSPTGQRHNTKNPQGLWELEWLLAWVPCFLFYLRGFFFVCVFSFLFACFLFCLRGFFYVCSVSLVGHRT